MNEGSISERAKRCYEEVLAANGSRAAVEVIYRYLEDTRRRRDRELNFCGQKLHKQKLQITKLIAANKIFGGTP